MAPTVYNLKDYLNPSSPYGSVVSDSGAASGQAIDDEQQAPTSTSYSYDDPALVATVVGIPVPTTGYYVLTLSARVPTNPENTNGYWRIDNNGSYSFWVPQTIPNELFVGAGYHETTSGADLDPVEDNAVFLEAGTLGIAAWTDFQSFTVVHIRLDTLAVELVGVPGGTVSGGIDTSASGVGGWQFILCETPDPRDPTGELEEIGELESARNRNLDIIRNRAGSASCTLSVYDDFAGVIFDNIATGDVRGTLRKSLLVRRNKIDLWSGPIMTIRGSLADGASNFEIGCVGWLEYLFHRELFAEKHYTNQPQDQIAWDLLLLANTQDPLHPVPIFRGTSIGTMALRSPTFAKGDTFGPSIQKLSDVESGFDMEVHPRTRKLNIFAWDSYTVRPDVKLGYRWGPENLAGVSWDENGANTRNRFTVTGNNNLPYSGQDTAAQDIYGVFEETRNLPAEGEANLLGYVNAELVLSAHPPVTYTVTPKASRDQQSNGRPRLFDDFQIGDQISFTAKEGHFEVKNQGIRVFGASVSISDDNVETVNSLQTSPAT